MKLETFRSPRGRVLTLLMFAIITTLAIMSPTPAHAIHNPAEVGQDSVECAAAGAVAGGVVRGLCNSDPMRTREECQSEAERTGLATFGACIVAS